MNKEEKEDYVYTYTQKIISQVVSDNDKETIKAIKRYCEENNIFPNLISEEKVKEILQLGIACKPKIDCLQSQLDIANKKLDRIDTFIRGHQLFGMRFAKTLYRECLEYILSIIGGE